MSDSDLDDSGEPECEQCGESMTIPPDLERTPLCNLCAQDLATRVWERLPTLDAATRAALGLPEGGRDAVATT